MKCVKCGHEAPVAAFRYLYNARIDAPIAMRQCPKCAVVMTVNELTGEAGVESPPGRAPWGKSAGIERDAGLAAEDLDAQEVEAE